MVPKIPHNIFAFFHRYFPRTSKHSWTSTKNTQYLNWANSNIISRKRYCFHVGVEKGIVFMLGLKKVLFSCWGWKSFQNWVYVKMLMFKKKLVKYFDLKKISYFSFKSCTYVQIHLNFKKHTGVDLSWIQIIVK